MLTDFIDPQNQLKNITRWKVSVADKYTTSLDNNNPVLSYSAISSTLKQS